MDLSTTGLLVLCFAIALGFEFVNGFHDTANAVATVIYTRSLKPGPAVAWSGLMNFLGVLMTLGTGAAVAFKIVNLLPTDILASIQGPAGLWMILSVLITAVFWNVLTWYYGIPASSSHTLIGSILGVGLAAGLIQGKGLGGLNLEKTTETLQWLLISPLIGFSVAGLLHLGARALVKNPALFSAPDGDNPPPWPIRILLIGTCSGVSYVHGQNDGQKGIGLAMLILIALVPQQFTVNQTLSEVKLAQTVAAVRQVEPLVASAHPKDAALETKAVAAAAKLHEIEALMAGKTDLKALSLTEQTTLRADVLQVSSTLKKLEKDAGLGKEDKKALKETRESLAALTEYVAPWVVALVALALGVGTTIGYRRVVVTVGEKIGKSHMTYAQGACAELTAMATIALATMSGAPVSTTHVVSSGIAGTMAANKSGLQPKTIRNILMAWVLTLPVTITVAGLLFWLTAGRSLGH